MTREELLKREIELIVILRNIKSTGEFYEGEANHYRQKLKSIRGLIKSLPLDNKVPF